MTQKFKFVFTSLCLATFLSACGGGGGGDSDTATTPDAPSNDGGEGNTLPDSSPIGGTDLNNFSFAVDPSVSANIPERALSFIESQIAGSIAPLNRISNLFNNSTVPVTYSFCGRANASYTPATREITLCDELTEVLFFLFLGDGTTNEQFDTALVNGVSALNFVLYHEIGHALDDISDLGVGGNFESVADAIAVVLSVQTGDALSALFGGAFLETTTGGFAGVHGSGPDRAGDIICWTIGSSSQLAILLPEIATEFANAGRDCVGEYADQFAFVEQLIPELRSIPPKSSLRSNQMQAHADHWAALDKMLKNSSNAL